jgi:Contractile injection system tube protein
MERVAFLIEETGERIGCLLNPESLIRRRTAGVRPRYSVGGLVTGKSLADDQLIYTGAGLTDLQVDLLFDVSVSGSTIATEDVRDLTQPFWNLSENARSDTDDNRPPLIRFIWGKSWNIPGVICSISERLESFTSAGVPRRSWLRLRMLRAGSSAATTSPVSPRPFVSGFAEAGPAQARSDEERVHEVIGGGKDEDGEAVSERLDEIAWRYYLDPSVWRPLARLNDIANPLRLWPGLKLRVP